MSYTHATPSQVSKKASTNSVAATKLKNGMRLKVIVDKQSGDDGDRVYQTVATIANLRHSKSGKYIHFDLEEVLTDESVELTTDEFVHLA